MLYPKHVKSYSNNVVEFVVTKVRRLKAIVISIYQPPDTTVKEWKEAMDVLKEEIQLAQSNGDLTRIILGGDLNFPNLKWDKDREPTLYYLFLLPIFHSANKDVKHIIVR